MSDSQEATNSRGVRRPLSAHVYARIVGVSTLSVIVLATFLGWRQLRDTQRELVDRRASRASIIARAIDGFFLSHERAVTAVATLAPPDAAGRQRSVDILRKTHPDILTALASDASGAIVAASPPSPPGQAPVIGLSVADRDYFRAAMSTRAPFTSGAFLGRGFGRDPIVAIAAPIIHEEAVPQGIVEASIDLRRLESFTSLIRGLEQTALVIADPDGMVVFSTMGELSTLSDLSSHAELREAAAEPASSVFVDSSGTTWSVATGRSERGWLVYLFQQTGVARRRIAGQILVTVLLVALLAIVSHLAAGTVARRVTKSLQQLAVAVRSMRGGEAPASVPLPHSKAPVEVAELFDDVRAMAERVHASRRTLEQSNRQLEEMLDLARAGSRTKTAFLAKMSHELRTPLNAVIGFNGLLEQRLASDPKGAELARRAHAAGRGMLHMIDELLEIARVESGQVEMSLSEAPLAEIVAEGVRAAAEARPGAVDRIALVAADAERVRVDTGLLAKTVASVAAAAAGLTAATVRVDARKQTDGQTSLIVVRTSIRELVDRDTLASLLDPFWQGETGNSPVKFGETRLGLAIAHRYAEIMHGNLDVATAAGETIFTIRVPDQQAETDIHPSKGWR